MENEPTSARLQLLIQSLTEILTAALMETELENIDKSDQHSIFGIFETSSFRYEEKIALPSSHVNL